MYKMFIKNDYFLNIEEMKLLNIYRTLSWILTSLVYLISDTAEIYFKLAVIMVLYISLRIVVNVYKRYDNISTVDKAFVFIETISITLILLPTGGLTSPFIWYALNPVLISAYFFSNYFCWVNLFCYLSVSTAVSYLFYNQSNLNLILFLTTNSQLILTFILITFAVQLVMVTNNKLKYKSEELEKTNNKLNKANERINESLEHIMSMYQAVEILTSRDNELSFQTFANYTLKLTKTDTAFFYYRTPEHDSGVIAVSGVMEDNIKDELIKNIEISWEKYMYSLNEFKINLASRKYIAIPVRTSSNFYGLVGAEMKNDFFEKDNLKNLKFISDLTAVILERFELDIVSERLTKSQEQNRIANEMHDSVAQSLFSISCATHLMANNFRKLSEEQLEEKLISLQESSNAAMKELRSSIYKLSSKKGASNIYIDDIKKYLSNISKLNNVNIDFQFNGDEEMLDIRRKNGLYRIISEATGNAIRHGKSSSIKIDFIIEENETNLTIKDNGDGFDSESISNENSGLGLRNMSMLINSYNGEIEIKSEFGVGTQIEVKIPNRNTFNKLGGLSI